MNKAIIVSAVTFAAFLTIVNIEATKEPEVTETYTVEASAPVEIVSKTYGVSAPMSAPKFEIVVEEREAPTRYYITPDERTLIERVVMGESGNQGTTGEMLVAQCILNACEKDGIRPAEAVKKYQYAGYCEAVTDEVKDAVANVFDAGETITDEPILYFYAFKTTKSAWHESQTLVIEHKDHRFFKEV